MVACGGKATEDEFNSDAASDSSSSDTSSTSDSSTTTSDTSTLPKTDGGSVDYCKALAERATKCGSTPPDALSCERELTCYRTLLRPEDYDPLVTCLATRDCATKDDTCVANTAMKYISDPWTQNYVKACNEKRTACMSGFADDYCGYDHGLMKDEWRTKFQACLSRSCAEIKDCFNTITEAAGCK